MVTAMFMLMLHVLRWFDGIGIVGGVVVVVADGHGSGGIVVVVAVWCGWWCSYRYWDCC